MNNTVIQTIDLKKTYTFGKLKTPALNGVSISLEQGLFYAITGRSGSGKSTLLHIMAGLDTPTSGQVLFQGKDLTALTPTQTAIHRRRFMGFVFQQFNLMEEYTVENNITLPVKLDGRRPDRKYLKRIAQQLGIDHLLKKYPTQISGGEQQRVAIARSLIAKPPVVFADEPTGNLDTKTSDEVLTLLRDSAREYGQTLVMVTHDLSIARQADVVIHLEDGLVVSGR